MRHRHMLIGDALLMLLLASCKKEEAVTTNTPVAEPVAPAKPSNPTAEAGASTALVEATPATAAVDTEFSVESVPVSTVSLPPFPFFKTPEGLENNLNEKNSNIGFERHFFLAGKKLIPVEGKLYHNFMKLNNADSGRQYSEIEFHRNYENAITAVGGK